MSPAMQQIAFTGFNGFGQFVLSENEGIKETSYKIMSQSDTWVDAGISGNDSCGTLLIAPSWRYTAYAIGRQLLLRGLLSHAPKEVLTVQAPECIKALAVSEKYCLVLLEKGSLYKILPQLNATLQEIKLETSKRITLPQKRPLFGNVRKAEESVFITHIACGLNIAAAISVTSVVYSIPTELYELPRRTRAQQLECGLEHALLLTTNGDIYTWGNGLRGQLGQETLGLEETPTLLEALAGVRITFITAGGWHSAAISAFGDLYTWGFNVNGQLGIRVYKMNTEVPLKEPTVYPLPHLVDIPICCSNDDCSALQVFAGSRHTLLKRSCGRLWAVGWLAHGQLGIGEKTEEFCESFKLIGVLNVCDVVLGPWCTVLYQVES